MHHFLEGGPTLKKRFLTLRCALMANETTQYALAHDLGLSPSSLSKRLTGKVPWRLRKPILSFGY